MNAIKLSLWFRLSLDWMSWAVTTASFVLAAPFVRAQADSDSTAIVSPPPMVASVPMTPATTPAPIAGDGHVHAPAPIEVGYAPLHPDEVPTIVVRPLHASVLVFPYNVYNWYTGDPGTFAIKRVANTLLIKTKDCLQGCVTDLMVYLDDGLLTVAPYLLIVDSTRTPTLKRIFTDPIAVRLHAREVAIATALEAKSQADEAAQLEAEVGRCVANGFTFRPAHIANTWYDPATGESIGLSVVDVGFSGSCLRTPKIFVRYGIDNARYASVGTVVFHMRQWSVATKAFDDVRVLDDQRAPADVPSLRKVRGELVLDGAAHLAPGDRLDLSAVVDGHPIAIGTIYTAPKEGL